MKWITIEEFNKDPKEGIYWVFLSGNRNDKDVWEYYDGMWTMGILGIHHVRLSKVTHVMPIDEPSDP